MTKTVIRPARTGDIPAVVDIVNRAFAPYVPRIGRDPAPMLQDYAALGSDGHLWVAEHDGEIGGMLACFPKDDAYFVETIAIDPGRQGSGLGRILMQYAETLAAGLKHGTVSLYTNAAMTENIAFYDRLGYSITGRGNEDGFERIYFEKEIGTPH